MAHITYLPNKWFLYAIGNTPAICLTSELPPEQPADILLLGCGDVRSVLYTVYADLRVGSPARKLDVTCCDIEPAILARNVLLYTLLVELQNEDSNVTIARIWNFYYHVFIDEETLNMLLSQCQRLADLTADPDAWNNSKYRTLIRFCNQQTLANLHRHWLLYIDMKKTTRAEKDSLRNEFLSRNKFSNGRGFNLTSVRAAGPLWGELEDLGDQHFNHYWRTGVTFTDPSKIAAATHINPTFAYSISGKGIALHYGADPILSFHLAKALAPLEGETPKTTRTFSVLVECATSEFTSWCHAFNNRLTEDPSFLVIRFFTGDSLSFCRALHYCNSTQSVQTPIYTMTWSTTLITLDGGDYLIESPIKAPLQFNVIETSNLRDYLGLVNILVTTIPLLQRTPSSTIYTNTMHPSKQEESSRRSFEDELCGDITTMCMLLDLTPVSYVSNFTTYSNAHEKVTVTLTKDAAQFHEHIAWKIGSLGNTETLELDEVTDRRLEFDPRQLALFLFSVYLKMFSEEDVLGLRAAVSMREFTRRLTLVHYTRASFVALLQIIKDRIGTDWGLMILLLHDLITTDTSLIIGNNSFQALFCALYVSGVQTLNPFLPGFSETLANSDDPIAQKGWTDIPPVVCITFKVPRKKLKHIENLSPDVVGNPILVCNLISATAHNYFQHFLSFFGDVNVKSSGPQDRNPSISFEEDPRGIRGSSAVIFSFWIPTWIIRMNGSRIEVALSLRNTPAVGRQLHRLLGTNLILFSASLVDNKYVFITRERPGNVGEVEKLRRLSSKEPASPESTQLANAVRVTLDQPYRAASLLTRRVNILDEEAQAALVDKAPVEVKQISPQAMQVSFAGHRRNIPFPCPVDSTDVKTRIARKSSYVEVDVKPSRPLQKLGMALNPFPIIKSGNGLCAWNIHYLDLECLPVLDLSVKCRLEFVQSHMWMMYSDRELKLSKAQNEMGLKDQKSDPMLRVKQTIYHLFLQTCGFNIATPQRIYGLSDLDGGGLYCLIFVNGIRLDLASHTLVLDVCVLPKITSEVEALLGSLGQYVKVKTNEEERRAWKQLLPAFVERCRTWHHTENCEYRARGVPVSLDAAESPLCNCGVALNLGLFAWKSFIPYVTRAGISPLFSVPFVDTVGGTLLNIASEMGATEEIVKAVCAKCGSPGRPRLLLCGKCRRVSYCSAECQKADWKLHKKQCKK